MLHDGGKKFPRNENYISQKCLSVLSGNLNQIFLMNRLFVRLV